MENSMEKMIMPLEKSLIYSPIGNIVLSTCHHLRKHPTKFNGFWKRQQKHLETSNTFKIKMVEFAYLREEVNAR